MSSARFQRQRADDEKSRATIVARGVRRAALETNFDMSSRLSASRCWSPRARFRRGNDRRTTCLLPVPAGDLALNSTEGWDRLRDASHAAPFVTVAMHSARPARNQAFCSVATAATMLNALSNAGQAAPVDGFYAPHPYFTQRSIFESACVNRVPTSDGSALLSAKFVANPRRHAARGPPTSRVSPTRVTSTPRTPDAPAFRDQLRDAFSATNLFLLQRWASTFCLSSRPGGVLRPPRRAYDESNDAVLIMDVSRYKYPPVWTPLETIFDAMLAVDDAIEGCRCLGRLHGVRPPGG